MNLKEIFEAENNKSFTENGDVCFKSTKNPLLDILFMSEYFSHNTDEATELIGNSPKEKLFSMFIRDPRNGLGRRDLGRALMKKSKVSMNEIIKAGRFDDLWHIFQGTEDFYLALDYLYNEIKSGNELAKKWMPRYSSKNLMVAREIAKYWKMNKQQYGKFIKCDTVEEKLSRKRTYEIEFDKLPSLALLKYAKRFKNGKDTMRRFEQFMEDVKSGKKKMNVSVTTVYDILKNIENIDADLFFNKIEKISGSFLPVVDTSGSMMQNDNMRKAMAIGHYLAKCSTYMPNHVISFSSDPKLIELGVTKRNDYYDELIDRIAKDNTQYGREIRSMFTGDCSNTDFGAVCRLIKQLDVNNAPEWLVVLSDMQFDAGSCQDKDEMMRIFKGNGIKTKLIWWNFNNRGKSAPETDEYGNIFMSGYSPMLLKFLETGFDGEAFLNKLLQEYANKVL
jgi:hypothetical protein